MIEKEAKERIEKLKELINYHRYLYHVLNRQEISDEALDSLKKELFDLESKFPNLIASDSPTQRVGGSPLTGFKKVKHPYEPMLSLFDAFSKEDMEDWERRYEKIIGSNLNWGKYRYFCELKLDGLAIELIYKNGILTQASTRGDGKIGEDITQNAKTIEAIPLKILEKEIALDNLKKNNLLKTYDLLKNNYPPRELVVRGEVFLDKKEFRRLNKEFSKLGQKIYANPRNLAAGSLRQLDSKITASRRLDSFAYDLVNDLGQETHEEKHRILKSLGFKINNHNKLVKDLAEVLQYYEYWTNHRESLSYEIDGVVVILNKNDFYKKAGVVGKGPRGAIAFKFPPKEATTVVEDIILQIGRTNVLTPVAILKPVKIGGALISKATLHNVDEVRRLDIKIGDTVIVSRAGDVIPQVVKVIKELRTGKEKIFKMPSKCPFCGSPVKKDRKGVFYRCTNQNCYAAHKEKLKHFIEKGAFDIDGLGIKNLETFLEKGLIKDAGDLFFLEKKDISDLFRFGEKSAQNIIKAIQKKKSLPLANFIYALGINLVGQKTAYDLSVFLLKKKKIKTPMELFNVMRELKKEDFEEIKDIGPKAAESIFLFFKDKKNINLIKKLEKAGIKILIPEKENQILKGKTFLFTGSLKKYSRQEAQEIVVKMGGKVLSSVSKNLRYLVVGKNPGSKLKKAKELGIKTIDEEGFLKIIKKSGK